MARRIAQTTLNASTIDILNVIRQNAPYDYQQSVPHVAKASDIPKVGEVIYGTPAFANHFINALVNRIAIVRAQSATFNNPYKNLKKGYLEFGETIEDVFVQIAKVVEYSAEKADAREFKRTLPDVRSAFYAINWRVMYPVTIQDEELKRAFLSMGGVQDLIAKIVDSVYTAAENDEFLLFKYLLIKAITKGQLRPVNVDATNLKDASVNFRAMSNLLMFPSKENNEAGVTNTTPKDRQVIFMDSKFNAKFDVEVLASAFNMDKADFMGRLYLVDSWSSFDNERFETIRANSDGLEEVTTAELQAMEKVKAVLLDENWFQVYDNQNKFTEKYIASGLYWNYFYHTWKTVAHSPFANAIVFVENDVTTIPPATLTVEIIDKSTNEESVVLNLGVNADGVNYNTNVQFVQTNALTAKGIGIQKFGSIMIPNDQIATEIAVELHDNTGKFKYTSANKLTGASNVGDTITMTRSAL